MFSLNKQVKWTRKTLHVSGNTPKVTEQQQQHFIAGTLKTKIEIKQKNRLFGFPQTAVESETKKSD